jgi:hypothetical protein
LFRKLRSYRPGHATVVAYLALFVALGGSSYAALSVGSSNIRDGSIRSVDIGTGQVRSANILNNDVQGIDIANGTIRSQDVQDHSLLAGDFAPGQLPQGPQGAQGLKGDTGDPGKDGKDGTNGTNGATNVRKVIASPPTSVEADKNGSSSAPCDQPGEHVTGGGYIIYLGSTDVSINVLGPTGSPTEWTVAAKNLDRDGSDDGDIQFAAIAICASP